MIMLALKLLSLLLQGAVAVQVGQHLRLPYRFGRWLVAWYWLLAAMILMVGRRSFDLWASMALADVLFGIGVSAAMLVGFQRLGQIFQPQLGPPRQDPLAHVVCDQHSQILEWDATATRLFGWPAPDAIGQTLMQTIIPPHSWEAHRAGIARYLTLGEPGRALNRTVAVTARRHDGREIPVELTIIVMPGATDSPVRFVAQIRALVHL